MKKTWYKNKNAEVRHPAFMQQVKKTISTTLPLDCYEYAKTNNLQFSFLLTQSIQNLMGGSFRSQQETEELLKRWVERYNRLQRFMVRTLGQEETDKIIAEAESIGKMKEKLDDKTKGKI